MRYCASAFTIVVLGAFWSVESSGQEADGRFTTGLLLVEPERYQSIPLASSPLFGVLPSRADMSADFPKPGQQGRQGSCAGWAVAYALKSYQERVERQWLLDSDDRIFSPAWVYNQIKKSSSCYGGAYLIDALNLASKVGLVPMSEYPYSESSCSAPVSAAMRRVARPFSIATWRRVNMQSETEVKEQIASGFPVVIGMLVDDGFMEMRGPVVYAGPHGQERGAHALVIVGYDDEVGAFRVINSWGVEWADRGFGWISFEAMRERALEGYVAQDIVVVKPNKGTPTVRVVEEAAVPESPVMDNSGAPIAELGLPVMSHNVVTQRGPAMAIRLPGRIRNARGSSAQVVVRFFGLNGSPLRANIYEYQYRDATGYVAVGTTLFAVDRQTKPLPNVDLVIPYYALNLVPTGGNFEYHLTAEASLYVDGFVVASTPRVPFVVRW